MKILIAGDTVATKTNENLFEKGDLKKLLGKELLNKWEEADVRIFNLETPITDELTPITKSGPNLAMPTVCAEGIKALNPTVVCVANNHILDQGEAGWNSTRNSLKKIGVSYVGGGENIEEASEPKKIQISGKSIGIYACTEHEFSFAGVNTPGANVYEATRCLAQVRQLKEEVDFVIVLYHGGKEHYPYPTPNQMRACRGLIEAGADIVVSQHSHCIGCKEEYKGKTIVYGQGNFIFDYSTQECWKTSLIVEINLKNISQEIEYIPICKQGEVVREAQEKEKKEIISKFFERSHEINQEGVVEKKYSKHINSCAFDYLYHYAGWSRIQRGIDKKIFNGAWIKRHWNKKKQVMLLGLLQCETHREVVETYLRENVE